MSSGDEGNVSDACGLRQAKNESLAYTVKNCGASATVAGCSAIFLRLDTDGWVSPLPLVEGTLVFAQRRSITNQAGLAFKYKTCFHHAMTRRSRTRDQGLTEAIAAAGGIGAIARICGIAPQAVSQWETIPHTRVLSIERATGVPREVLRPDLYGAPRPRPRRRATHSLAA